MIAEIKGKVNRLNTNLTALGEDELTGNFFGNMRYIPFDKGLKKILKSAVRPAELGDLIDEIDACYWDENLSLWERMTEGGKMTELDVTLDFPSVVIGIEVKYQSGLSSQDETGTEDIRAENSVNQLSREARVLHKIGSGRKKLLLLLADDSACAETVRDVQVMDDVRLGYFSWQEVLIQLRKLTGLNRFEQLVISDLIALLERKGFFRFSAFDFEIPDDISAENHWYFELPVRKNEFSFVVDRTVEKKYYEFG